MGQNLRKKLVDGKKSGSLSKEAIDRYKSIINFFEEQELQITDEMGSDEAFKKIKNNFDLRVSDLKKMSAEAGTHLSNMFHFIEEVYGDGQEMVIIVTELTSNQYASGFISRYGCKEYFNHNKELLFYERQNEIDEALKELKL
jgi:hypothetical protein